MSNNFNNNVIYHSPKQKRELVAKNIEKTNPISFSLRHNPPTDIIEPKGKKIIFLFSFSFFLSLLF